MRTLGTGIGMVTAGVVVIFGMFLLVDLSAPASLSKASPTVTPVPTIKVGSPIQGEVVRGRTIYMSLCYGCHATEAKVGPAFASEAFKSKYQTINDLTRVVRTGRHPMPGFPREQLNDQNIADLIAYIKVAN